ncbi:MAG TPA: hypothetical protein VL593_08205 [Ramlibacter sp.]|nr:hypothetical protein [Ramlibacter sp.]
MSSLKSVGSSLRSAPSTHRQQPSPTDKSVGTPDERRASMDLIHEPGDSDDDNALFEKVEIGSPSSRRQGVAFDFEGLEVEVTVLQLEPEVPNADDVDVDIEAEAGPEMPQEQLAYILQLAQEQEENARALLQDAEKALLLDPSISKKKARARDAQTEFLAAQRFVDLAGADLDHGRHEAANRAIENASNEQQKFSELEDSISPQAMELLESVWAWTRAHLHAHAAFHKAHDKFCPAKNAASEGKASVQG